MGSLCLYRQQPELRNLLQSAVLQATIVLLSCSITLAHDQYLQETLERKVTISLRNVTLEKALTEIEKAVHVKFVYSRSRLKVNVIVSVEATDRKLADILKELLTPRGIDFANQNGKEQILLFLQADGPPKTESGLLDTVPDHEKPQQQYKADVTGTVLDATTKQALPGVNVIVRGTTNGTSTNADGKYSLKADDNDLLVFSFIGYKPFETHVAGRILIDVSLESDVTALNEVVINAGYYDVKQKEATGSIVKVTSDVIEKQPVTNPLGALQGRMPGVFIQQTSGIPGGDFNIQIRGKNSLRLDGNEPLYIVDGVPFSSDKVSTQSNTAGILIAGTSPLTSINPSDIESIEVLKDADVTSIYGSRGANGVVLITTKKGKVGKTKIDINVYTGAGKAPTVKLLNTQQYIAIRKEAFANDGYTEIPPEAYDVNGTWDTTRYTDWQKKLIGNIAQTTSVQSSLSGGSGNTQFIFSAGYRRENSVFPGNLGYQKGSFHLSVNHLSENKKLTLSTNVSGTADKNNQINSDFTFSSRYLPPNAPKLYDENGDLNWENSTWSNPLAVLQRTYVGRVNNLIGNTVIGYEVLSGLHIKTSFGLNTIQSREFNAFPSTAYDPALKMTSTQSAALNSVGSNQSWIIEPQATWLKTISKGNLSILIGSTFQDQRFERSSTSYSNFPSNALINNLASAAIVKQNEYVKSLYRYMAVFGRINYNWDGKYVFNVTARRDGSSRFGPGRQFANFGAVGVAWIFSNESIIKNNLSFLSFGKLRTSLGSTGSDQIGNYQFLDTYSTGTTSNQYQGMTGLIPTRLFNPDFAWETNTKIEGAVELGFFNDRVLLNVGYYRNRSSNQLVNYTLPKTTGFTGILANLGATVQNTGLEVDITSVNTKTIFHWTTSFNITIPRNKLIEFPNIESSTYANRYTVGQSIYIQKFYKYTGVDPQTGLYTIEDFNQDGAITVADDQREAVFIGQDFYGGLNNSVEYKGWKLDIFLQFVKQSGRAFQISNLGIMGNQPAFLLDKRIWRKPGDVAEIQRLTTGVFPGAETALSQYLNSDATVTDASFIRVKNISVSYQLPLKWTKNVACRFYSQAQNLFVITRYKGFDPESQLTRLAPLKMLTVGIQLTL